MTIIQLQKPMVIIVICLIGLINAMQLIFMIFTPVTKQLGSFYPYYFAFSALLSFVSLAGMWSLKKWAALLYAIVLVSNQLLLLSINLWEVSATIIPMIILILLFNNRHKMT